MVYFCPACLFEHSFAMVKSEGNRCTRNCFTCPSCTAPLSVVSNNVEAGGTAGPWILACEHCRWTTLEIGIEFEKPVSLFSQLSKIDPMWVTRSQTQPAVKVEVFDDRDDKLGPDARFSALRNFYTSQLSKSEPTNPLLSPQGEMNYNSPNSLARIMSLYTGAGKLGKKNTPKSTPMREAMETSEGLVEVGPKGDVDASTKLQHLGWAGTTSVEQRAEQPHAPRFLSDLRPVPTLLRAKKSRRCRACRHILVKPDPRIQNTRYRIRLVAFSYVPSMTVKPLASTSGPHALDLMSLPSSRPLQFLLTLRNPMFDPTRVRLAAQPVTPGRFGSRVTILCPQFEIGANSDVWDEALDGNGKQGNESAAKKNQGDTLDSRVAEAGKIWAKGRNWTTIVLEVVCAPIDVPADALGEDEDVLEIPMLIAIEYDAEVGGEEGGASFTGKEKERRELAYWTVLGIGKIAR